MVYLGLEWSKFKGKVKLCFLKFVWYQAARWHDITINSSSLNWLGSGGAVASFKRRHKGWCIKGTCSIVSDHRRYHVHHHHKQLTFTGLQPDEFLRWYLLSGHIVLCTFGVTLCVTNSPPHDRCWALWSKVNIVHHYEKSSWQSHQPPFIGCLQIFTFKIRSMPLMTWSRVQ